MLDLMLGSGRGGFSTGELFGLYWPTEFHHLNPVCSCGNRDCNIWNKRRSRGSRGIYSDLFSEFSQINYIVDSSKSLTWIAHQSRLLARQGIEAGYVLIWKNPEDFAKSCIKRGRYKNWHNRWVQYHRGYFHHVGECYTIQINDLLNNFDREMSRLCGAFEIPYDESMREYWNKEHHVLFGSATARLKLHQPGSRAYEEAKKSSRRWDIRGEAQRASKIDGIEIPEKNRLVIDHILSFLRENGLKKTDHVPVRSAFDFYRSFVKLGSRRSYFFFRRKLSPKRISIANH